MAETAGNKDISELSTSRVPDEKEGRKAGGPAV